MFATLVTKELRAIVLSPKFVATFSLCSLLILLSTFIGVRGYQTAVKQYETATQLTDQQLRSATSWRGAASRIDRKPDPLQVFASGVSLDVGRYSNVSENSSVKLTGSAYSEDSIYAYFRFIDFAFIVQIVLSLFAILFTFDAVSGEREDGTLRLLFSNPVPRARFLMAKCTGAWLGLVIPIAIPVTLSLLMVVLFGVPMSGSDWVRLLMLMGVSLLFFTFFIALGVMLSTFTKRSSVSFLLGLVAWVAFVLIIPRVGTAVAGQVAKVPPVAEIEAMKEGYSQNLFTQMLKGLSSAEVKAGGHVEVNIDSAKKEMDKQVDEYGERLMETYRQKKGVQERLALSLARVSPVSAYQLATMTLAGNDLTLKSRFEDAFTNYRTQFVAFKQAEMAKGGSQGAVRFAVGGPEGVKISVDRSKASLNMTNLPAFVQPTLRLGDILPSVVVDIGILLFGILVAFGAAFAAFLRYDLR
jgi:ABC-type transport system involved in multi-copper enzyme maturation permease subunit